MQRQGGWANVSNCSPQPKRVCVLLLNWNGWKDTIECLESVFRLEGTSFEVVVCDNASQDGSLEKIEEWARGDLTAGSANLQLSQLIAPPVPKPIPVRRFATPEEAISSAEKDSDLSLKLIETGSNLGFAGGNNCGLRYCIARGNFDYVWLLNNDTVVCPNALSILVAMMEGDHSIGICGSTLRDYWDPTRVEVYGGKFYSRWSARFQANHEPLERIEVDYVDGASMLVSQKFLDCVGVLDESYFLYFEELDWARSAAQKGFRLGFSSRSVVYHKQGASVGTHHDGSVRSLVSERFLARNRVYFTRRFHAWALPTVSAWILLVACRAALAQDWIRVRVVLAAMFEGFRVRLP
jgi:GT2 family glycosyltransferase